MDYVSYFSLLYLRDKMIQKFKRDDFGADNNYVYKYGLSDEALSMARYPDRSIRDIIFYEELLDTDFPIELKEIFSKFVNYVDPLNLEYCLVNLNYIKLNKIKKITDKVKVFFPNFTLGFYNSLINDITVLTGDERVLSHEFLHMASSCYFNPDLCGFHIISVDDENDFISIGTGLNEGYTELLNSRIFYNGKEPISYPYNVGIVKLIECFFDDYRDMEWAYFHNDINSVYRVFCKYGTREEFFSLMNELDNFTKDFLSIDFVNYYKLKYKLYEIIKRSDDKEKIERFEKLLYESPVDSLISKVKK